MIHTLLRIGCAALLGLVTTTSPAQTGGPHAQVSLFRTADRCMGCHNGLVSPSGEDISFGTDWSASMMANSARDPYWQASVRREVLAHPNAKAAIEDECSTCHMPMMRYRAKRQGAKGRIFAHLPFGPGQQTPATRGAQLAADGVSCSACHQIQPDNLGTEASFVGGFEIASTASGQPRPIYGPFDVDRGHRTIMRSAVALAPTQGKHMQSSELCASCHTLYTHTLGPNGEVIGELPEQVPYLEWRHSAFRGEQSCQSCHMPVVQQPTPITGVLGKPREGVSRHVFRGGNFFMLRMLSRYRNALGVQASAQALDTAARRTVAHLGDRAAELTIENARVASGTLQADVGVTNLTGHKLPTAYPSRRVWLEVTVRNRNGDVVFSSGELLPNGRIRGNDNDNDPGRYEPHYTRITEPSQVQIYEAIMADPDGQVTTGLLAAIRFIKDNRVLPRGFDKTTADPDIAVQGNAVGDGNFTGAGDRVGYAIDVADAEGPFNVKAELWYQPIAYRWAHNLKQQDATEIDRFVGYYNEMAGSSAVTLAHAAARVTP